MKRFLPLIIVCLLLTAVFATACTPLTKIADIVTSPLQYEGKEVIIQGNVTGDFWFRSLTKGLYNVQEDTSAIWVVTDQMPPQTGTKVKIRGVVNTAAVIGDQTLGTHITEISRK